MTIGEQTGARRWLGAAIAGLLLAVAVILAAGCGSGSRESGQPRSAASGGGSQAAGGVASAASLKFSRCMRDHGIDIPDPDAQGRMKVTPDSGFNPANPSPQAKSAQKACSKYLGPGSFSRADQQRLQEAALRFARCMRAHGVHFPDPNFSGGTVMLGGAEVNPNDPTTVAANKACQKLLPEPPGS
jgi:hypothetical protein